MTETRALIVAEPGSVAAELQRVLRSEGFEVQHHTPGRVAQRDAAAAGPDFVLVSASLGLLQLTRLHEHFAAGAQAPNIVVFPEDDLGALEACVVGGFDYITPPFLPALLRSRVSSCGDRWRLRALVEEMAADARVHEYEKELSIAHEIQSGFLPDVDELPSPEGWDIAARFRPAKEVAGDFFDVFELVRGHGLGLVVADVCDKGVGAALFMAIIRTLLRHTAEHATSTWDQIQGDVHETANTGSPAAPAPLVSLGAGPLVQAVVGTNGYLARHHLRQGYFATLFFGVLDPASGALLYINGGHNPPVLLRADGSHILLDPTGPAVGMLQDSSFSLGSAQLESGDALLMYTDGVTESRDCDGAFYGMDRLLALAKESGRPARDLIDVVDGAIREYSGDTQQFDDITMLAVTRE